MKSALLFLLLAIGCHPPASIAPDSDTEVAQRALDATVLVSVGGGHGSGFFVDEDTIVTAAHVLAMGIPRITTRDGQECTAVRSMISLTHDLGIVDVTDCQAPALPLGADPPLEGATVWAAGSPLEAEWSITKGVVADADHKYRGVDLYVLDAAAHPGMSGGPVVDSQGRLVGVLVMITTPDGRSWGGRTFIVPADQLAPYLD